MIARMVCPIRSARGHAAWAMVCARQERLDKMNVMLKMYDVDAHVAFWGRKFTIPVQGSYSHAYQSWKLWPPTRPGWTSPIYVSFYTEEELHKAVLSLIEGKYSYA